MRKRVLYCEEPPDFAMRKDLAHVTYHVGGDVFEFVMQPSTLYAGLLLALEMNAKWRVEHLNQDESVPMITKRAH